MLEREDKNQQLSEPSAAGFYTARDYLSWQTEELMELIRGKIFKMSPGPRRIHQRIVMDLGTILNLSFRHTCETYSAPFDVYLIHPGEDWKETRNIVQPDLCVICDPKKLHDRGCIGAPDLVVEILSPGTAAKDLGPKRELYLEYGVKEMWIVHPTEETITIHVLENGKFHILPILARGQILQSPTFSQLSFLVDEAFPD